MAGSLVDPTVDPTGKVNLCKYIFYILRYACVLLIATQFILSMGNRPQGAQKMFMAGMVILGIVMAYTTFCSVFIVVKEFETPAALTMGNNLFSNLIVSTCSTIGLYFLMSFLYLDPWHMFTSSAQYFALLPSYICTLQIYAFCNAHDISWGTKGDNIVSTDLGAAKTSKGAGTVELDMPSEQLDIDSGYDESLRNLRDRVEVPKPPVSESQAQEDYYRAVRTYMVVAWMVSNGVLAMSVSEAYGGAHIGSNMYLKFILWSVACLALFRAIGSSTFLAMNVVQSIAEGRVKFGGKGKSHGSGNGNEKSFWGKVTGKKPAGQSEKSSTVVGAGAQSAWPSLAGGKSSGAGAAGKGSGKGNWLTNKISNMR